MASSTIAPRRRPSVASQLGLSERIFASAEDRSLAAAIDHGLDAVEDGLRREMHFADGMADVTARYLLDAGGKRVRPMLALLTAQLGAGALPQVLSAAQAVEITHLASLYHDDVMDEATMRRGVPSAQVVWGNSVAVLTGDLLFARASKIIASLGVRAIQLQADTFERLCLGQLHETTGPRPDEDPVDHYIRVLSDKTGSLIALAAQMGVVFSNAPAELEPAVVGFGERIGVAFQLVDDVIDLSPSEATTGKKAGTDLRAGVATLPLLKLQALAVHDPAAGALLTRIDRDVVGASDADEAAASSAIADLRAHAVTTETLAEAHRWAREAVQSLEPLPDGSVRKALSRFADSIVERTA